MTDTKPEPLTTAWSDGRLRVETAAAMSRSDVVSTAPLATGRQSMPLGNGRLAAMVWNEEGYTAQLNRTDTWPYLRSAGRLVIPSLRDFGVDSASRLSLYDASLIMQRGDATVASRLLCDRDLLVVDVAGVDPEADQVAEVRLWAQAPGRGGIYQPEQITRSPQTFADGATAGLWELFTGPAGDAHGFVSAVAAEARDVRAEVVSPTSARVRFRPNVDGTFRIVAAVPSFTGTDPTEAVADLLGSPVAESADELYAAHDRCWHDFWEASHLQLDSPNGDARYLERQRNLYFYVLRSSTDPQAPIPATAGGGSASPFMFDRDYREFGSLIWHFNTRNAVFANAAGDHLDLTEPYRRYYIDHLDAWRAVAGRAGKPGACPPEVTRYDGSGDGASGGSFVKGITSDGLEVAWNLWEQYRHTRSDDYLQLIYPFLREAVRFQLASLVEGADGRLHIVDSAANETYLHVDDPVPDLAGIRAVFPAVIEASRILGEDPELRRQLTEALPLLADYPRDPERGNVVAAGHPCSTEPTNVQNPELELVYPFGLVGDDDALTDLMRRTLSARRYPLAHDWAPDAVWAARLGLGDEAGRLAALATEKFQVFACGLHHYAGADAAQTGYVEGLGLTAAAVQEMAMQSHDGLIRIAPALPRAWRGSFSLRAVDGFVVSSQIDEAIPRYVGIASLLGRRLRIRNPWPGQVVRLRTDAGDEVLTGADAVIEADTESGRSYVLERAAAPISDLTFAPVTGRPVNGVTSVGRARLGVGTVPDRADLAVRPPDVVVDTADRDRAGITVFVRNDGAAPSGPTIVRLADVTTVPEELGSVPVPSVAAGDAVAVRFEWATASLPDGVYRVRAVVNPDREVVESDGTNNEATVAIRLGPPPATVVASSTQAVEDAAWPPANVIDGDLTTYWSSSADASLPQWVQVHLHDGAQVASVVVRARRLGRPRGTVLTDVEVATARGTGPWVVQGRVHGNTTSDIVVECRPPVDADRIRVTVQASTQRSAPIQVAQVAEIRVFDAGGGRLV